MDNAINEITTVRYISDDELVLNKTQGGFLSLTLGDKTYKRMMLQRAFPLSKPTQYISVREIREDREPGEEIGVIEDIDALSPEKKAIVEEELAVRYFTPQILQITKLKDERGFVYMEVVTTSGPRKITANNNSSSFIRLSAVRVLIVDVDGNRFDIPDMTKLDKKSIRNLEVVV